MKLVKDAIAVGLTITLSIPLYIIVGSIYALHWSTKRLGLND